METGQRTPEANLVAIMICLQGTLMRLTFTTGAVPWGGPHRFPADEGNASQRCEVLSSIAPNGPRTEPRKKGHRAPNGRSSRSSAFQEGATDKPRLLFDRILPDSSRSTPDVHIFVCPDESHASDIDDAVVY
jgi:hypothetical protein